MSAPVIHRLDTSDWEEAFSFADGYTREDVAELAGISEGENDGDHWVCYGRLHDGRWFYLNAWCDYTGWGCQAGGTSELRATREECERLSLTESDRLRFEAK